MVSARPPATLTHCILRYTVNRMSGWRALNQALTGLA
jgi:hypothetical protein